jgi:hypothetical protein
MTREMHNKENVLKHISTAFSAAAYPGDDRLRGSDLGDEPYQVEQEFRGKRDWRILDARFLDEAPGGLGSALSFFSQEAFRFYIPAYMSADIRGQLERVDPVFHLTHGLERSSMHHRINPELYGDLTWFEYGRLNFLIFTFEEAAAIVDYLCIRREESEFDRKIINEALENYWNGRVSRSATLLI